MCLATIDVTSGLPSSAWLGEDISFSIDVTNNGISAFGPFVDIILPAGADEDDGLSFISASYLGSSLVTTTLTGWDNDEAEHPYAVDSSGDPLTVSLNTGESLIVIQLPFGSYVSGQSADIDVTVSMSNLADANIPLEVDTRGWYQYGCDALDNPTSDPSVVSSFSTTSVTPSIFSVTKTDNAPEDDHATGPNFPYRMTISADIADGQYLSGFSLNDQLPDDIVFSWIVSVSPGWWTFTSIPLTWQSNTWANALLSYSLSWFTGSTSASDVQIVFEYYILDIDALSNTILDPTSGDDVVLQNIATAQWDRIPLDGRDSATTVYGTGAFDFTAKSIATQKSVSNITDASYSPGDTVEYIINVQISDYFTFSGVTVTDLISDGQRFDATFTPTFTLNERNQSFTSFSLISWSSYFVDHSQIGNDTNTGTDGSTTITFDLSEALIDQGGSDGVFQWGRTISPDAWGIEGTVIFRAIIQDSFSDTYLPNTAPIDLGDTLTNNVTISGHILTNSGFSLLGTESDTSATSFGVVWWVLDKQIYALNGSTSLPNPLTLSPGDEVTYRLMYTLPSSDAEDFSITDYIPLPVYSLASFSGTFDQTSPAIPDLNRATRWPTDTLHTLTAPSVVWAPTISVDVSSNLLSFTYGDFNDSLNRSSVIDLLFTVEVTNEPFADGLQLTNLITSAQGTTNAWIIPADDIVQVTLWQPDVHITKGIVQSDNSSAVYDPVVTSPTAFTSPGDNSCPRFIPTINSDDLLTSPIDSNISELNGGDTVTFAITLENQWSSKNGAFDVVVADTLPTGFVIPGTGLNFCITDGNGAALAYQLSWGWAATWTDIFGTGITLVDDWLTWALLSPASTGENIAIITYDLITETSVQPTQVLENIATLTNFSSVSWWTDFTTEDRSDNATASIISPVVDKLFITTDQSSTNNRNVVIGEQVDYEVTIGVPQNVSFTNVLFEDTFDNGLALVSLNSISASGSLSSSSGTFAAILSWAIISNSWRNITMDFGTLTNSDTDEGVVETIVIEYTAVVINAVGVDRNDRLNNNARITRDLGAGTETVSDNAQTVRVREPILQLIKTAPSTNTDSERTVTYQIEISHTGPSDEDAFDVYFEDPLLQSLTYVTGSYTHVSWVTPDDITFDPYLTGYIWRLDDGQSSIFTFQATLDSNLTTWQVITNTAFTHWTSISGELSTPVSPYDTRSVERTGTGGAPNDYTTQDTAIVQFIFDAWIIKWLVTTNQSHTTGTNVTIGEELTYETRIVIPEDSAFSGLTITDTIDTGLSFLEIESITASGILVSSLWPISWLSAIISWQQFTIDFGTVTNTDLSGSNDEWIVIRYRSMVDNSIINQDGHVRNNIASLDREEWWAWSGFSSSASMDVTIVEPALRISKSSPWINSGSSRTIRYELLIEHDTGSSADAFNLVVSDDLLSQHMAYVTGSISLLSWVSYNSATESGWTISIEYDELAVWSSSRIAFDATLASIVTTWQSITNNAFVEWTGLPGTHTGERTGTGGVNNYITSGSTNTILAFDADMSKSIISSNQSVSTGTNVVIGEEITYNIAIELLDNTSYEDALITDTFSTWLSYVRVESITASGWVSSNIWSLWSIIPVVSWQTIRFDFGTLLNSDTNTTTTEYLLIEYTVRVDDLAESIDGATLGNSATFNRTGTFVSSGLYATATNLTVLEPDLMLTKTATWPNDQQLITYTITVDHSWMSTIAAQDLLVTDNLSGSDTVYVSGSFNVMTWAIPDSSSLTELLLERSYDELNLNDSSTVQFSVQLTSTGSSQTINNTGIVSRASLPATSTGSRYSWSTTNPYVASWTTSSSFTYADLALDVSLNTLAEISVDDTVTYTITLTHEWGTWVETSTVIGILPSGVSFVSATPSTGTYVNSGQTWTLPSMMSGDSYTLDINVRVDEYGTRTYSSEIESMDGVDVDSIPSNNSSNEDDDDSVSFTLNQPSGGWWGGWSSNKDSCPSGDYSDSYYDDDCGDPDEDEESDEDEDDHENNNNDDDDDDESNDNNSQYFPSAPSDISSQNTQVATLWFKLPQELLKTGTPVKELKAKWVDVINSPGVDTYMYDRISIKDANTVSDDLSYRLDILPYEQDKDADVFVVVPKLWIITPIVDIPGWSDDFETLIDGREIDINPYLKDGAVHYPNSAIPWQVGNFIAAGHSSYYNDDGRYHTIFTSLPLTDIWDEVRVYSRAFTGEPYRLFKYRVSASYNTDPSDVEVLLPWQWANLTLFTCTPVGWLEGRWIIKATLIDNESTSHSSAFQEFTPSYEQAIDTLMQRLKDKYWQTDKRQTILVNLGKKLALLDIESTKKKRVILYLAEKVLEEILLIEQAKIEWFDEQALQTQYQLREKLYWLHG